jgi:hypothetical protein
MGENEINNKEINNNETKQFKEYELSAEDIRNLLVFLSRSDLKGAEVEAYVIIVNKLRKQLQELS